VITFYKRQGMVYAPGLAFDVEVVGYSRKPELNNHSDKTEFHFGTCFTMNSTCDN
jgi:hypothetical protein